MNSNSKMPCWYYEKKELKHTPSMNQGMPVDQEIGFRRDGARFILQIGNKLGLRYETMATGVVFFHRFYMVQTFQEFPRHVTACCCLFLAGKVEETPKKCKDIMSIARRCLTDDSIWSEFGKDPKEEVMTLERILLQTMKFDFIVEHPYSYLLKYAKSLKGDKKKLHQIVQMAWTFVNDSLCTTLCLQWEPEIIAIALIYLAGKLNKVEVSDWQGKNSKYAKWWDMFVHGISLDLLEDICHQVLDLYAPNKMDPTGTPLTNPADCLTAPTTSKSLDKNVNTAAHTTPQAEPPIKKCKKDDSKSFTPSTTSKTEPVPHTPTQPQYNYPPHYTANFPPTYPPPPTTPVNTSTPPPPPRYPYQYQPPPVPTARYPPPTTTPPAVSAPPPSHYPTIPYQPPTASHYPPPPLPHATSYYHQPGTPVSRQPYPQHPPAGHYDNSPYMHSNNRSFYPT